MSPRRGLLRLLAVGRGERGLVELEPVAAHRRTAFVVADGLRQFVLDERDRRVGPVGQADDQAALVERRGNPAGRLADVGLRLRTRGFVVAAERDQCRLALLEPGHVDRRLADVGAQGGCERGRGRRGGLAGGRQGDDRHGTDDAVTIATVSPLAAQIGFRLGPGIELGVEGRFGQSGESLIGGRALARRRRHRREGGPTLRWRQRAEGVGAGRRGRGDRRCVGRHRLRGLGPLRQGLKGIPAEVFFGARHHLHGFAP